ncbi:hypothetical protein GEW_10667 [Pasteurella multocida subsp. gallicida str. Anand1_poultry]|nr:hypothetical protein GEW_10667 [Pasteurella multocida subsp. gallicida str. Anand1_poultry]
MNLAFDMKYAHFFDPQTEKSLLQLLIDDFNFSK